jgi:hypothetical protein
MDHRLDCRFLIDSESYDVLDEINGRASLVGNRLDFLASVSARGLQAGSQTSVEGRVARANTRFCYSSKCETAKPQRAAHESANPGKEARPRFISFG